MAIPYKQEFTGDGSEDTFEFDVPAASNDDLVVLVDLGDGSGPQEVTAVTVDSLGLSVVFDDPPALDAVVTIAHDTGLTDLGIPEVEPPEVDLVADTDRERAHLRRLIADLTTRVQALEDAP
jgi:hypothetical protein